MSSSQHAESLLQAMRTLYQRHLLTDLTLVTTVPEQQEFAVHKAVMATFSSHFLKMLEDGALSDSVLEIHDIQGSVLAVLIDFMYTGDMRLTHDTVSDITQAAESLQIGSAVTQCHDFMATQSHKLKEDEQHKPNTRSQKKKSLPMKPRASSSKHAEAKEVEGSSRPGRKRKVPSKYADNSESYKAIRTLPEAELSPVKKRRGRPRKKEQLKEEHNLSEGEEMGNPEIISNLENEGSQEVSFVDSQPVENEIQLAQSDIADSDHVAKFHNYVGGDQESTDIIDVEFVEIKHEPSIESKKNNKQMNSVKLKRNKANDKPSDTKLNAKSTGQTDKLVRKQGSRKKQKAAKDEELSKLKARVIECCVCEEKFVHWSSLQLHQKVRHKMTLGCRQRIKYFNLAMSRWCQIQECDSAKKIKIKIRTVSQKDKSNIEDITDVNPQTKVTVAPDQMGDATGCEWFITVSSNPTPNDEEKGNTKQKKTGDKVKNLQTVKTIEWDLNARRLYQCKSCEQTFPLYTFLRRHVCASHGFKVACKLGRQGPWSIKEHSFDKSCTSNSHQTYKTQRRRKIYCKLCNKEFVFKVNLRKHMTKEHPAHKVKTEGSSPLGYSLKCRHCDKRFKYRNALLTHLTSHNLSMDELKLELSNPERVPLRRQGKSGYPFKCSVCGKGFWTTHHTRLHMACSHGLPVTRALALKEANQLHPSQQWACPEEGCAFMGYSHRDLRMHMAADHPHVMHNCVSCKYATPLADMMIKHCVRKHKNGQVCDVCGKQYRTSFQLRIHRYSKHNIHDPRVKLFHCEEEGCDYFTFQRNTLEQHMRSHQKEKPYECPHCHRKLKTERNLEKHMNKVHRGIRPYVCELCGATYGEESELKMHIVRHDPDHKHHCHMCNYSTQDKANLQSHMWTRHKTRLHKKQKLFSCEQCPYTTDRKTRFRDHMHSHTQTRPEKCGICQKTFITRNTLRGHIKWVHSSEKLKCHICDHKTSTTHHLREHIRIMHSHRMVKPYKCAYCDFHCATTGNCRKHCMNRHKGVPVLWVQVCEKYPGGNKPDLELERNDPEDPESSQIVPESTQIVEASNTVGTVVMPSSIPSSVQLEVTEDNIQNGVELIEPQHANVVPLQQMSMTSVAGQRSLLTVPLLTVHANNGQYNQGVSVIGTQSLPVVGSQGIRVVSSPRLSVGNQALSMVGRQGLRVVGSQGLPVVGNHGLSVVGSQALSVVGNQGLSGIYSGTLPTVVGQDNSTLYLQSSGIQPLYSPTVDPVTATHTPN